MCLDLKNQPTETLLDLRYAIEDLIFPIFKVSTVHGTLRDEAEMTDTMTDAWIDEADKSLDKRLEKLVKGTVSVAAVTKFVKDMGKDLKDPLTDTEIEQISAKIKSIYKRSKGIGAKEAKIKPKFTGIDERAVKAINKQQVFWVGNFYNEQLSKRVQAVSEEIMIKRGLGAKEAGKELGKVLRQEFGIITGGKTDVLPKVPASFAGREKAYFEGLASDSAHKSRMFGKMRAYGDAGVITYRIMNPMDNRTGTICQQMFGQVFSVDTGLKQVDQMISAKSPEDIKRIAPWLTANQLQTTLGGARRGSASASERLAGKGAVVPPFHFKCRSEIVII